MRSVTLKLTRQDGLFIGAYPSNAVTIESKIKHLEGLLRTKSITKHLFLAFAESINGIGQEQLEDLSIKYEVLA